MSKRNVTYGRKFLRKIENWLEDNWERASKGTQQHAADLATREIGIPITKANIAGACKAIEKPWPARKGRFAGTHSSAARLARSELLFVLAMQLRDIAAELDLDNLGNYDQLIRNAFPKKFQDEDDDNEAAAPA